MSLPNDPLQSAPWCLTNFRPEESIGYLIKSAYASMQRAIDIEVAPMDLTAMQWTPLLRMAAGQADTAAELARVVGMDTGAMTRMLDRLEHKGLIRRSRSAEDRRVIKLELTEEGRHKANQIPPLLLKVTEMHFAGFDENEREIMKGLLRRMLANGTPPPDQP
ncbi:MarR family transcriptional regulator [Pigmentiphaga aceris]|uniref:MarR family transcriptional regulator n=1 Tax=Pigmentiphaga aceris TaxID=1940612 RepID=A0A5C0AY27_9BURK|nr:MarR family transcriptional regulator [Pigmentiphaga aceris]QEI07392.1 MarR family transcriptional regulator [Pigmentiphaga aceris]